MNPELLWVFIPSIAAISLTPGMCMTLAFTLGLSQGYRRTLWMMWGELAGVATVVSTCASNQPNANKAHPPGSIQNGVAPSRHQVQIAKQPAISANAASG